MPGDSDSGRYFHRLIPQFAPGVLPLRGNSGRRLLARLQSNAKRISEAHEVLSNLHAEGGEIPAESEWLLGNYYVIDEACRQVRDHLPRSFYRQLPQLHSGPYAGFPRVYPLALTVVGCGEGTLVEKDLRAAVTEYQQTTALRIGELWAIPIMLRLAVIELLRGLVDQILRTVKDRQHAATSFASIRRGERPALPNPPSDAFSVGAWEVLREEGSPNESVDEWVGRHLNDPQAVTHREFCRQAANQVSIGNAVTTLRVLSVIDWNEFFEATSLVEQVLRNDPAGIYPRQDFATRDRCRRAVEKLALRCHRPEVDVARAALVAASGESGFSHVSYFLLGKGQTRFRRSLGEDRATLDKLREWFKARPGVVYFGLISVISLVCAVAMMSGMSGWWPIAALLPVILIASEIGVALTNFLVRKVTAPRVLAKMDYRDGLPSDVATFVVIPTLITKPEQARALAERLESHYLSNPDPMLSFALLVDFSDAPQEEMPEDASCVESLREAIGHLNATYVGASRPRFFAFHRSRRWNEAEGCWMGWERKRGKLDEFNKLLRGSATTSYVLDAGAFQEVPKVRYVLTLDTDTVLPRDAAKQMIATLSHPLNHPRYSNDRRRIVAGYAILQPRVSFLYRAGFRSWFARLFAGSAGVDPYSSATSDTYMDLFGRGSFTGKGLYDVDAFSNTAGDAFPENAILSHDLIESSYARCALATDIEVFDEFPSKVSAAARRDHRWIRGDWQLIPWLGLSTPSHNGTPRPNVLPLHERWKVLDNLRRSLVPAAGLILLLLSWTVLSPWLMIAALVPWLLPGVLLAFETLMQLRSRAALRALPQKIHVDFRNTFGQALLQLAFLPEWTRLSVDAIVRSLVRVYVTKRKMLEWETAAAADARLGQGFGDAVRSMLAPPVVAFAASLLILVTDPARLFAAGPVLLLWFAAPFLAWFVSRPRNIADAPLTSDEEAELRRVAAKTWSFFERHVGEADHWLPPDNFQESPLGLTAHRTSPTNIGLYLLAVMAAHDFKFINLEMLLERIRKAFDTLHKLERHRGHFFNWYETNTLVTMHPPYVSTVDSGNLLACLLTIKHGLHELEAMNPDRAAELAVLAGQADVMAAGMHFGFLYNSDRELFSIGYNAATNRLDTNHYDLLASEACIASFLAVARGEVPRRHWFRLGRLVTLSAGQVGLVSWGGTMFEYLMPRLLLPTAPGVLLDQAQRTAVARQIEYGRHTRRPWGISESGFALLDAAQVYQYQSFGVPGLGLKRGLDRDHVIAPYATLMATDVDAAAAVKNFAALAEAGGEGPLGFYEALDYTPERCTAETPRVVKSYMAHHQGMGLVAILNRLSGGVMRERFRREPAVRAAELLLDERVPYTAPVIDPDGPGVDTTRDVVMPEYPMRRRITTAQTLLPRTHLLSNGRYTVMVTNSGGGFSRCGEHDVTRWHADSTSDSEGQFLYLRDRRAGRVWSAAHHPTGQPADEYEVTYSIDKAEFRRLDGAIESRLEITVVPDHDAEVRRLTLVNRDSRPRMLDATSYAEIVLAAHAADAAHPAFGKLFVESEWLRECTALLFRRRPRAASQQPIFAIHALACDVPGTTSYESSREAFLGRCRSAANPRAFDAATVDLSGGVGAVLDPIASIRRSVLLKPGERAVLAFTTGYAANRDDAVALAERYSTLNAVNHAFELAWAHARIELQGSHWKSEDVHLFQRLAGHLFYPTGPLRAVPATLTANRLGQSALWAFGISGDLPILLLRMHSAGGLSQLRQLLPAHAFWSSHGFPVDLVILLENAGGYHDELEDDVTALVRQSGNGDRLNRRGGIFIRKGFQMTEPERTVLLTAARVVLDDRSGPVASQADTAIAPRTLPSRRTLPNPATQFEQPAPKPLQFENVYGGFSEDGKEYHIHRTPPAPWSNVIANERGGFLVTDSGGGFVWAGNSQSNRLTPWSNDPVSDPPGEAIYLCDEAGGSIWCPTPLPVATTGPVRVRHGQGWTVFEREVENVQSELTVFMPLNDPIKISLLKLKNASRNVKRLEITYYAEWVLGTTRESTLASIVSRIDPETGALLAGNRFSPDFPNHIAFADCDLRPRTVTCDRAEFLGRNGLMSLPASFGRAALSGAVGAGFDPCAALRGSLSLAPGESRTIVFLLGQGSDPAESRRLMESYRGSAALAALQGVKDHWAKLCEAVQVRTPEPAFDLLMNRWLVYQTISCRLWGRSAFYQSGGAYGFRDQLQDVCALVHACPEQARAQILRAARRQFLEGDVQHWWHEPAGNGVRTRFSDDFLWLPYTVAVYVNATDDVSILHERIPYLDSPPLKPEEHEVYGVPNISEQTGSVFEHCQRAIDYGWRLGTHGLPLIGTGDWNDGFSTVGSEGKGESVWVGWFQCVVLEEFAKLAERLRESSAAVRARANAQHLRDALEANAWDGEWYRRAYFDDGTPLGSAGNDECQIDSLAQSWAVIAKGPPRRAEQAMDAVLKRLVKTPERLILLFTPPFDSGPQRPGYIRGYLPGVRENGGQYTHAAAWVIKALAGLGRGEEAHRLFNLVNPIAMPVDVYRGEPYVIAADVYSAPSHIGRAGWTWYTGSSAWLYRVGLEDLLGLHREGSTLTITPCLPKSWPGFHLTFRFGNTRYEIEIKRSPGVTNRNGGATNERIALVDDGAPHEVVISISE